MNLKELKDIIQIIQESDIEELEIEREGVRIRVKKKSAEVGSVGGERGHPDKIGTGVPCVAVVPEPTQPPVSTLIQQVQETPPVPTPVSSSSNVKTQEKELISIVSPMVGTFYRVPSSDADPYVELGSIVKKGQVVCVVEAMKLMNEIESEVDGKIVKILVENERPVEYGQVLFQVEPL